MEDQNQANQQGVTSQEYARITITRLEEALQLPLELASRAHLATMRASEEIGRKQNTGAAHACLALMEVSLRALRQANDAARYARHSIEYPPR